jgi:hypothetical protein
MPTHSHLLQQIDNLPQSKIESFFLSILSKLPLTNKIVNCNKRTSANKGISDEIWKITSALYLYSAAALTGGNEIPAQQKTLPLDYLLP